MHKGENNAESRRNVICVCATQPVGHGLGGHLRARIYLVELYLFDGGKLMVGKLTPNNMLSASRIAQLMGQSPYATQNELLSEFIDRDAGKEPEPWEGNELTRWGDIR